MTRKEDIALRLDAARARTLSLIDLVPEGSWCQRVHSFYSPIGWHFGHIARTEEYWVCRARGADVSDPSKSFLFADLPENPKEARVHLPTIDETKRYMRETRCRALDSLDRTDIDCDGALLRDGCAWEFAYQHECQHQETILELLCLIHQNLETAPMGEPPRWDAAMDEKTVVEGSTFTMGTDCVHAYDNEKRAHEASVESFMTDSRPTTSFEWSEFMCEDGYSRRELWSEEGWQWKEDNEVTMPQYWSTIDGHYFTFSPNGRRPILPDEPAASISCFEAEAFTRWKGARLLTEAERELLAARETVNGNIWEWTSDRFMPYPGFEPFPYDGYSKSHMEGSHRSCRGGSWASANVILRPTFRNWYLPSYREGFLGLRCAYPL